MKDEWMPGKNRKNGIRRATNSPIRRADRGRIRQKWAVCATRATNSRIRRADRGKIRQKRAVCATHATNLGIRRAEIGKNRKTGIRRATNSRIRRADRGKIRQKWAVCATRATNPRMLCKAGVKNGQIATWLAHTSLAHAGSQTDKPGFSVVTKRRQPLDLRPICPFLHVRRCNCLLQPAAARHSHSDWRRSSLDPDVGTVP
jgi:hypothetical protein